MKPHPSPRPSRLRLPTLGDYPRAQHHLHAAARQRGSTACRECVLQTVLLATSYARAPTPDLDRAVAAGDHALHALTDSIASPRCTGYLSTLVDALAPHRQLPAVRNFTDRARPHLLTNQIRLTLPCRRTACDAGSLGRLDRPLAPG